MVLITDSVALKLINSEKLLIGVGNELRYYFLNEQKELKLEKCSNKLFDKIHGIHVKKCSNDDECDIVVYGGREFMILKLSKNNFNYKSLTRINDWINSIQVYENNICDLCVLTSHSVALNINLEEDDTVVIKNTIRCTDQSTLYSSLIIGKKWTETTVFGGTALGELIVWTTNPNAGGNILHQISAHNGVIFSIDFNSQYNLLTTTSDDRSVKIWKLDRKTDDEMRNIEIMPTKTIFGHTARVFKSKIIAENEQPFIISIGEDSNVCLWTSSGTLLHRHTIHQRGTLWNCDYDYKTKTIFTCSSDGNIDQFCVKKLIEKQELYQSSEFTIEYLSNDEHATKVRTIKNDELIFLTSKNKMVCKGVENNNRKPIEGLLKYNSSLLECFNNMVATAGYQIVSVFKYTDQSKPIELVFEKKLMNYMVRSCKFISNFELIVCDEKGNCALVNINSKEEKFFKILTGREKWITSAVKMDSNVLISDRSGNLHLYIIDDNEIILKYTLKYVHGKLGCTSLIHGHSKNTFLSSGHDGTVKTIEFDRIHFTLKIIFTKKIPIQWIDKIIETNGNIYYAGFNDNHFVMCSDSKIIAELECGGGHRYWDLSIDHSSCTFIYLRNKKVYKTKIDLNSCESPLRINHTKWHTKYCNVLKIVQLDTNQKLIVSGGEDNILKFHTLTVNCLQFIGDITTHISTIKGIVIIPNDNSTFRVISVGGRAQICVSDVEMVENSIQLKEVDNFMLKLNDNERKRQGKANVIDVDPETRFMDLAVNKNENDYVLYIGCSDGFIRQFSYSDGNFTLITSTFCGTCTLNVNLLNILSKNILLTMGTNGLITFWDVQCSLSEFKKINELKHHQSGVNSYDIMLHNNLYYLATGGDDQSVVISTFSFNEQFELSDINTTHLKPYHIAQVNGVRFSMDEYCLYTTGVDQTIWRICLNNYELELVSNSCIADIRGIQILSNYSKESKLLVFGNGLQIISNV